MGGKATEVVADAGEGAADSVAAMLEVGAGGLETGVGAPDAEGGTEVSHTLFQNGDMAVWLRFELVHQRLYRTTLFMVARRRRRIQHWMIRWVVVGIHSKP